MPDRVALFSVSVQTTATAAGKLNADGQRRLSKVSHLLTADTSQREARERSPLNEPSQSID
jgi:hypothetical protein